MAEKELGICGEITKLLLIFSRAKDNLINTALSE